MSEEKKLFNIDEYRNKHKGKVSKCCGGEVKLMGTFPHDPIVWNICPICHQPCELISKFDFILKS